MESAALVLDALGRVRDMVRAALKDLSPEELLVSPGGSAKPVNIRKRETSARH
jgi:hypothetical protein